MAVDHMVWAGPNLPGVGGPNLPVRTPKLVHPQMSQSHKKTSKFLPSSNLYALNFMLALVSDNKTSLTHINHKFSVSAGFYSKRAKTHCYCSLPKETEDVSGNHVGCIAK